MCRNSDSTHPFALPASQRWEIACVAYLAEAGADHSIYLAASINPEILAEIAAGHLPVLAAFRSRVWVVVIGKGGRIENAIEEPAGAISPKYLPPESLYVFSLR